MLGLHAEATAHAILSSLREALDAASHLGKAPLGGAAGWGKSSGGSGGGSAGGGAGGEGVPKQLVADYGEAAHSRTTSADESAAAAAAAAGLGGVAPHVAAMAREAGLPVAGGKSLPECASRSRLTWYLGEVD